MPCRSDHMEPRAREVESKLVAQFLVYLAEYLRADVEPWVRQAAESIYGNENACDQLTAILCQSIKNLNPKQVEMIIYNAHDSMSRKLADWWERHQEHDKKREAQKEVSFDEFLAAAKLWLKAYPADIFDGSSGDPGPEFVVAIRDAVDKLEDKLERIVTS